jgi:hypothetical protein
MKAASPGTTAAASGCATGCRSGRISSTTRPVSRSCRWASAIPASTPRAARKSSSPIPGGLDTSIILKWLQTEYGCEVVTFTADLGQGEELEPARKKAEMLGIKEIYIEDLREEFVRDFVFPMFRANASMRGVYLLGTSIARPLIAKRLVEIAAETGADAVAHGATGKGNDQVRFELSAYALNPDIKVIAPWREWDFKPHRADRIAEKHQIPVPRTSAARRRSRSMPTFCTPRPRARCWKTRRRVRRNMCTCAPSRRWTRPTADRDRDRVRKGRCGRDQWRAPVAGRAA